ncbi:MAG: UDP-N-acetylmuramate dehydrogenase [Clostridium sp.]|nr:UDP-N-acetylmuramate dehydrogenase [Clostridium sp.]
MKQFDDFLVKLSHIVQKENIMVNAEMKKYTSFKVGGPVDVLVTPISYREIVDTIELCKNSEIPYYILGNGSNVLVRDGGIRGVVLKLSKLNKITVNGDEITAESGATIGAVSLAARNATLSGLEFACGIPGSVGGALAMNAGAYDGEMSYVVKGALLINNDGELLNLNIDKLELAYRNSVVLKHNYIALEVTFKLKRGESDKIQARMLELTRRRIEKQPLEYPSAGSTFKRPTGYFAGKLIQDSELKGCRIGGAEVSMKHSGFIINKDNATAKDIIDLISHVQKTVKDKFGVDLYPEVRIIGEDK